MIFETFAFFEFVIVDVVIVEVAVLECGRSAGREVDSLGVRSGRSARVRGVGNNFATEIRNVHCAFCKCGRSPTRARTESKLESDFDVFVVCTRDCHGEFAPIVLILVVVGGVDLGECRERRVVYIFASRVLISLENVYVCTARGLDILRLYPERETVVVVRFDCDVARFDFVVAVGRGVEHISALIDDLVGEFGVSEAAYILGVVCKGIFVFKAYDAFGDVTVNDGVGLFVGVEVALPTVGRAATERFDYTGHRAVGGRRVENVFKQVIVSSEVNDNASQIVVAFAIERVVRRLLYGSAFRGKSFALGEFELVNEHPTVCKRAVCVVEGGLAAA